MEGEGLHGTGTANKEEVLVACCYLVCNGTGLPPALLLPA
jgi:hypothetical protein